MRKIIELGAKRMVYVSCNPATQARDLELLAQSGYALKKFSLVDQFHILRILNLFVYLRNNSPL